jgi:hypothetical protein
MAEIDTMSRSHDPFAITSAVHLGPPGGAHTAAVAADDKTVWVALGTRVISLDAQDLHTVASTTLGQAVDALAGAPSGGVYAATANAVTLLEPATGLARVVATLDSAPTRLTVA